LNVLISAWTVREPPKGPGILSIPNGICVDFARNLVGGGPSMGFSRVTTADLNILIANWNIKEPPKAPGIPSCMDTGYYNFVVNP
jgi:hypothetical protein